MVSIPIFLSSIHVHYPTSQKTDMEYPGHKNGSDFDNLINV